eukprot:6902665-Prymnesium_polylepis.1
MKCKFGLSLDTWSNLQYTCYSSADVSSLLPVPGAAARAAAETAVAARATARVVARVAVATAAAAR